MATTNVPPSLATVFTPPPACFKTIVHTANQFFVLGEQSDHSTCLPSAVGTSTKDYFLGSQCPSGWTTGCTRSTTLGSTRQNVVTCCPPGNYGCQTQQELATQFSFFWLTQYGCISSWGTPTATPILVIPSTGTRYTYTFDIKATDAVNAPSVQLRYNVDSSTASSTVAVKSSGAPETGAGGGSGSSRNGTTSWKIGVGVGLAVAALVLIGLGFWFMRRRRATLTKPAATGDDGNADVADVPELDSTFNAKASGAQSDIKIGAPLWSKTRNEAPGGKQEQPGFVSHPAAVELEGSGTVLAVELQDTGRV
ncbi:hypothetical protein P154DRAFT_164508 [Amniculicola lignicola CBS 123094]|uniref:Uncharacterized protein n=1 Tax=Amniculicola lignicola CBS 123094 TaxID=1392246 RepID=A0A6A5WKS0_9PLEO|nr:hypothetical protein P154DRAFT_164508 [Amniculicola lignicola CBS 123094]